MKTTVQSVMDTWLVGLLLLANTTYAQFTNTFADDMADKANSFEVGTYMSGNWTLNLMLAIRQPEGATIRIKDANNTVLYQQYLKKSRIVYQHKLNFEECKPGVYQVEVSDGRRVVVRRVEVVDIPAIESQRYITYTSSTNL